MLCPKCKEEISDNSIYCKRCGAKLEKEEVTEVKQKNRPNSLIENEKEETNSKILNKKTMVIVFIVLIVMVGGGFGTYKYVQARKFNDLVNTADANFYKNNYNEAIQLYSKALSYKDDGKIKNKLSLAQTYKRNEDIYNQGLKLINEKKYLEAIQKFSQINKEALKIYDDSQEKVKECKQNYINDKLKLAENSINSKEYEKAIQYLDEIEKIDKNNSSIKKLKSTIEQKREEGKKKRQEKEELNNKRNAESNAKLSKTDVYKLLENSGLDEMEVVGPSPLTREKFSTQDEGMYGHDCYYIGGKGGNAILFVVDAITNKLYSCEKIDGRYIELTPIG
ncbi:zinc-ribbon domain-containing protein [Clostridium sporogenes]|uniref:zinc-ribbon domain-containing protein n=1 Tax=Clostridium sporogenes TaxID=1509 RepID=UPI0013D30F9F|nr:zinc-ribbon domain-containing protein [Clostridium sporogenes]NFE80041.1 zinc-ribbon domain-containing protein [Clostridium sporogenes]NFG68101.1 zinc-ribbon domain-containing protein [Clostridium sporogenes]